MCNRFRRGRRGIKRRRSAATTAAFVAVDDVVMCCDSVRGRRRELGKRTGRRGSCNRIYGCKSGIILVITWCKIIHKAEVITCVEYATICVCDGRICKAIRRVEGGTCKGRSEGAFDLYRCSRDDGGNVSSAGKVIEVVYVVGEGRSSRCCF